MASTKIKVTLKRDEETGTDAGMFEALQKLCDLGIVPLREISLSLECLDGDAAQLRDDIAVTLTDRPVGIAVTIERKTKEEVERRKMVKVTPMERMWSTASAASFRSAVPPAGLVPDADLPGDLGELDPED